MESLKTVLPTITKCEADPLLVSSGDTVTFSWKTKDASSVRIFNIDGDLIARGQPANGSFPYVPEETMPYTLTAKGAGGSASIPTPIEVEVT